MLAFLTKRRLFLGMAIAFLALVTPLFAAEPAAKRGAGKVLSLPRLKPWTGDLDGLLKRRLIRILVPYSKTMFFVDKGRQYGVAAEFGHSLEDWLNRKYQSRALRIYVDFVPVAQDQLLAGLAAGQGDIAMGGLTITAERQAVVDFTDPWIKDVKEIVVTGPSAPKIENIDDLAGKEIYVRRSSSYFTHLAALNETLKARHLEPIKLIAGDENLEDADLLEMVGAGLLPMIVVDNHVAAVWVKIFPNLVLRSDLVVNSGGQIAWAIRKQNPQLLALLNEFLRERGVGTALGNTIRRRYYADTKIAKNAYSEEDVQRFSNVLDFFRRFGTTFAFDYLMITAQGYQESQLDQSRRSPRGAVGIMQLLPSTAADPSVGITGIDKDAERNINAGTKYLRYLVDKYINDPAIDDKNRTLMAFAAYNAGPGNLNKFRRLAAQNGLNPNIWFDNVEHAAAQIVGRETVQYVSNIYKYYIAYTLLVERSEATKSARKKLER